MNYINTTTLQYPVTEQDIKNDNPFLAFPIPFLAPEEYSFVFPSPYPTYDTLLEYIQESAPVLTVKGTWEQTWKVDQLYTKTADKTTAKADHLAKQKVLKKSTVDSNRKIKESEGLLYTFPDSVGTIQTEDEDIRNVLAVTTTALVLKAQGISDPVMQFRDKENAIHLLTPDEAISMGLVVQQFITQTYSDAWAKKLEIDSATTILNLNKVIL